MSPPLRLGRGLAPLLRPYHPFTAGCPCIKAPCLPAFSSEQFKIERYLKFQNFFSTRIVKCLEVMSFSVIDSNTRFEKSLGLLTTRFVTLLQESEGGILDLKVVSLYSRNKHKNIFTVFTIFFNYHYSNFRPQIH